MRTRLCLFTASPEPSGVGEHMLTLAAGLRDHYAVSFVCPQTPGGESVLARARAMGLDTLALDAEDMDRVGSPLVRWLRERRIDVFHCHAGIAWEGHGGVYAARVAGVPTVVRTEHLPHSLIPDERGQRHYRYLADELDALICVSAAVGASYIAGGVPTAKVHVVRNGIPIPPRRVAPANGEIWQALGLPPGSRVALTVARLTAQKAHGDLLAAVPRVLAQVPEAHFVWVGAGPLARELRTQARSLGVAAHVHFLGGRRDVAELLAAAHLFVLPSRFEGLPLAPLEAMAAGVPVVGTDVCGTAEVIANRTTGRLVVAGSPRLLAAAIAEALARPAIAARWGAAGRLRVERHFTAERMIRETAACYEAARATHGRYIYAETAAG